MIEDTLYFHVMNFLGIASYNQTNNQVNPTFYCRSIKLQKFHSPIDETQREN